MLSHQQWLKINETIQIIYSFNEVSTMADYFLDSLRLLVSYDKAMFYLTKGDKIANEQAILKNLDNEFFKEYLNSIKNLPSSRIATNFHKTIAYRDSDYQENRELNNEIYSKLLAPQGIGYGGGIVLTDEYNIIAELTIYRFKDKADFSDEELEILNVLKDHLKIRLTQKSCSITLINDVLKEYDLTNRENEIIKYLLADTYNDEIASKLNISVHTVKKHIQNIYLKLQISNRVQLIKLFNNFIG